MDNTAKKTIKKVFWCLLVVLLANVLIYCNKTEEPSIFYLNITEGANAVYKIVYSEKASKTVVDSAVKFKKAIDGMAKTNIEITDDWVKKTEDIDTSAREILIGQTNRAESQSAFEKLDYGYLIEVTDTKIVVVATNDYMLDMAVDSLIDTLKAENGNVVIPQDYSLLKNFNADNAFEILKNEKANCVIVIGSGKSNDLLMSSVVSLINMIKDEIGVVLRYVYDTATPEGSAGNEILVGETNRAASQDALSVVGTDGYLMQIEPKRVILAGASDELTAKAIDLFCQQLKNFIGNNQEDRATMMLPESKIQRSMENFLSLVPAYNGGKADKIFDCGNSHFLRLVTDTTQSDYLNYQKVLTDNGYKKTFENTIGDNLYAAYSGDKASVYVYYIETQKAVRIIAAPPGAFDMLAAKNEYTAVTETTLTQIDLKKFGLSAVYRLSDGRFLVIDGGQNNSAVDIDELYRVLSSQAQDPNQIQIAAWFFTHAHPDHAGAFLDFITQYGTKVKIEKFIYNFPSYYPTKALDEWLADSLMPSFEEMIKTFKNVQILKPYAGQKFSIANAEIEYLYTYAELYPSYFDDFNDSSAVFTVTIEGQKHIWLGDCEKAGCDAMSKIYGNYLKSDVLQISHHGAGGTLQIYQLIDPTVCLWPCTSETYEIFKNRDMNRFVMESENVKQIIIAFQGTYTAKLPFVFN